MIPMVSLIWYGLWYHSLNIYIMVYIIHMISYMILNLIWWCHRSNLWYISVTVCRIGVVSPKLTYDTIVHIKNMIRPGKKVKCHTLWGGCTDSNPGPSDRRTNAFPTKLAASPDALSFDESIRLYWDIYTRQIRLASKGWPGKCKVQDITGMILTMIS
jgi:hypothetical protein